jgi:hypothetical protein
MAAIMDFHRVTVDQKSPGTPFKLVLTCPFLIPSQENVPSLLTLVLTGAICFCCKSFVYCIVTSAVTTFRTNFLPFTAHKFVQPMDDGTSSASAQPRTLSPFEFPLFCRQYCIG